VIAAIAGTIAAIHYHRLGLTLSHYDARGHLVVARRIIDSLTPGWQQIGAVWLPLPHLLNALPVQVDAWYRSGASAVAISIAAFAVAVGAISWIVFELTESQAAAVAGAAVFALNPNMLYLQATPMTEPLLLALTTLAVAMLLNWTAGLKTCATTGARVAGKTETGVIAKSETGVTPKSETGVTAKSETGVTPKSETGITAKSETGITAKSETGITAKSETGITTKSETGVTAKSETEVAARFEAGVAQDFSPAVSARAVGWAFALACLTRYEAWPVAVAALSASVWALWRQGDPVVVAGRRVGAIAIFPLIAIAGFLVFSRVVIGEWFVASGFFTPENKALGDPMMSTAEIWYGLHALSGSSIIVVAAAGTAALLILGIARARWSAALIVLSLAATAAVPWAAFIEGHPFRIRYMVPLIAIEAIGAGVAAGLGRRLLLAHLPESYATAVLILVMGTLLTSELRPLNLNAPMVVEAQWDRPNVPVREQVTACLGGPRSGEKIMASMGSLGHYMQEASRAGFRLRDFLHEGNGDIWLAALASGPRPFADWVLIEEKAEGGDLLAIRAREQPHFLDGYSRVCEGAGLALYKRQTAATEVTETRAARTPKTH